MLIIASLVGHAPLAHAQASGSSEVQAYYAAGRQTPKAQHAADRKLAKQVRRTLARLKGANSQKIVVYARDGVVTLTGSVTDPGQIAMAVDAARGVSGVVSVDNAVRVKAVGQ